jgi:hypothetical protein
MPHLSSSDRFEEYRDEASWGIGRQVRAVRAKRLV